MTSKRQAFESFMDEALVKSLDEFTLERIAPPSIAFESLKTRLYFEGAGMKAQAFISCSKAFLQKTCPLPRSEKDHPTPVLKDWLGELGNLILGRLKNRLLAHDMTIKISAPSFDGTWARAKDTETLAIWYQIEGASIGFECSIEGEVPEIGAALKQSAEILPGDAIYRLNDPLNTTAGYDIISKIRSGITHNDGDEDDGDGEEMDASGESPSDTLEALKKDPNGDIAPKPQPIRILFHTQAPLLSGVAWSQADKLILHFSSGLEYTLCPKTLLDRGCSSLEVEDLVLTFQREGELIRASIPKYNMYLSKTARVA